ncbi:PEGA domain-containing protein [candidate division KSB1 bacterium]|nr:PEGA domain-containing protein [candidate division KSB1 bacterium]
MRKLIYLLIFSLAGCGVKQPVENIDNRITGKILVTSEPAGAYIFLDGEAKGKLTPDTLSNISVGSHTIYIIKDGFRSMPDSLVVSVEENKVSRAEFELTKLLQSGLVEIKSIPAHAEIFVDGQTTGKFTPDTVQVEAGNHLIKIAKNGYKDKQWQQTVSQDSIIFLESILEINRRILLEAFGNVSCTPCVQAAQNLHNFEATIPRNQFAIIEYYANWPSPNDPFYKEAPHDINQRLMHYQVSALPTLIIGGSASADATDYDNILATYQEAYSTQNAGIGLSIAKRLNEGELIVEIELYNFEGNFDDDQLHLFVAIVENNIHFDSPPGTNGLTDFDFVFRKFLTPEGGMPIRNNSNLIETDFAFDWLKWDYANCKIAAFIQNISSSKIIQVSQN